VAFAIPVLRVQLRYVNCINKRKKKKQPSLFTIVICHDAQIFFVTVGWFRGLRTLRFDGFSEFSKFAQSAAAHARSTT